MVHKKILRYETLILFGALMFIFSLLNVFGITNINSDVFWAIAGMGLLVEGFIEILK